MFLVRADADLVEQIKGFKSKQVVNLCSTGCV